jgi:hypothetical protein
MMPSLSRSAEHIAMAREIDEIAGGGENTFGALRHLQAGVGECDLVRDRRSTSSAPISRSSSRTCIDSAADVIAQSSAARPKCLWRASAAK